jgi:hypothetical protein
VSESRFKALAAVALACAPTACTEDTLVAVNAEEAPGVSTPTIEAVLDAATLPTWRDTTYWGFMVPGTAAFRLASDREDLQARPLGRFSTIPDSVFVGTVRVAIDSFTSATIRFSLDTARTTTPDEGAEVAIWSLTRSFDADQATWLEARRDEPWTTPGGDLGELLGVDSLGAPIDSLADVPGQLDIPLDVDSDSLLTAWRDSEGEPGFAAVVSGAESELRIATISLVMEAVPEGIDTVLTLVRGVSPSTFIFDPLTPEPTTRLRLAGLPSARYYLDFTLPDSVGIAELKGAIINEAALEFRPAAAPQDPFALAETISSSAVRLLADPFVYGEKTPIGGLLGGPVDLDPESLAEGIVLQYDITELIRVWTRAGSDSLPPIRVGIVPIPENRQLGFWEMFSAEDGPGVRPAVRILFTPNPSFLLP